MPGAPAGTSQSAPSPAASLAANAETLPSPDTVFQAWNDAFLVQGGSTGTYYTDELKSTGTERAGTWIAALDGRVTGGKDQPTGELTKDSTAYCHFKRIPSSSR